MPKTRINCPNCRQPIMTDIEQLFDVAQDPNAKQRLLSGVANMAHCPHCGYQGMLASPIVYHDPQKELLLTFFPPELNMQLQEQERLIGPLINQVFNSLPQEQRKGYLLRPQAVLTMQGLVERILEADGITREMIQAQQKRLALIQRLMNASDEQINEAANTEDGLMDAEFFSVLNRLVESAMMAGDEKSAQALASLQQKLVPITTTGRQLEKQSREVQDAIRDLQDLGEGLTREKLLDLIVKAESDVRVSVLVSLARPALDYEFFQILSGRIDKASGRERERLVQLREQLLEITSELDRQVEERKNQARQFLESLLQSDDIVAATEANIGSIDDAFLQVINTEMAAARKNGDLEKLQKLGQMVEVIQRVSAPPPEIEMIEELLDITDESARGEWMENNKEKITSEFLDTLTNLVGQTQSGGDKALSDRLQEVYRSALRFSMKSKLRS